MSEQPTTVLLARHGQTDWNVSRLLQGHTDIPLNQLGREQAQLLAESLQSRKMDAIYSSDLGRAQVTAQAVATMQGLQVQTLTSLRERNYGEFEGKPFQQLLSQFPEDARAWNSRDPHWRPAGGESFTQMQMRTTQSINTLVRQHLGQTILLVAHGGVLDAFYRHIKNIAYSEPRAWSIENVQAMELAWTAGQWQVLHWPAYVPNH